MKKFLSVVLLMMLLLTACGQAAPTWQEQYDLGVRYLSEGNYEEAIIAFTAAIEIDPKRAEAYIERGNAYIGSGETAETLAAALADYENAVSIDETNAEAYLGLADVYIRMGEYDKALEILKTGLEKAGGDAVIAEKIEEVQDGVFKDSGQKIRRTNQYTVDGELEGYTEYSYDELERRCGWNNYDRNYGENGEDLGFVLENYCIVSFNEKNLPLSNQFYDPDGIPTDNDTFVYNEQGLKTEQYRYDAEGELAYYFLFYYDERGLQTKYEGYYADGSMYAYWISEYDEQGNRIREVAYDADGVMTGYNSFK